jgi:small-conductance mechanosensitive channel
VHNLNETKNSAWRILVIFIALASMILVSVFLFDELVAPKIIPNLIFLQTLRVIIVLATTAIAVFIVRRVKKIIFGRRTNAANFFEFIMVALVFITSAFQLLHIFNVDTNILLISGGIISITVGLIVSTFVGDTLAGMLVFLLNLYHVGDTVLVNSVPCRVEEMSALVTRFRNAAGGILSVPNTAISQGGVIVTRFPDQQDGATLNRLPYAKGDRIYTTYMNAEGVVEELDSIHTRIKLDSGLELSFLNNSVLSGSIAVARIVINKNEEKKKG